MRSVIAVTLILSTSDPFQAWSSLSWLLVALISQLLILSFNPGGLCQAHVGIKTFSSLDYLQSACVGP